MIPTVIIVILATIAFGVIVWNQLLPLSSVQNRQFIGFVFDVLRHEYDNHTIVQQYVNKPIVDPIVQEIDMITNNTNQENAYFLGPQVLDSSKRNNVTLTFYVEYGNNQYLPDLLNLLYKYKIDKSVFFLDKNYSKENEFMVKRIQYNGYIVRDWKAVGEYDKDYSPTILDGIILSGKEILDTAKSDHDGASFLEAAVHYHDSTIIAFTPKIMTHQILLETLLRHNGKDITFVESNNTHTENRNAMSNMAVHTFNKNSDPILQYLQVENSWKTEITAGEWTMSSLADKFPDTVQLLADKNAFLIKSPLVVDKNASIDLTNQKIMLVSNQEESGVPSTFLEIMGTAKTGNTTILSYDPLLNKPDLDGYHPRPYVLVHDGGSMNLYNSTIAYLGFSPGGFENTTSSRPAITYYNTTGISIENSVLKNNYYGFYSDDTNNTWIVNNQVFSNTKNGLDSHHATNLYVSRNHIYNNGDQGFICSLSCLNATVANNVVEHNSVGIGLHLFATHSIIKDNIVRFNAKIGIFIQNSSQNRVINNTIIGNQYGITLIQGANENKVAQNALVNNIAGQIVIEPDSQSNMETDNTVYSSKDLSAIPQKIKFEMSDILGGEMK